MAGPRKKKREEDEGSKKIVGLLLVGRLWCGKYKFSAHYEMWGVPWVKKMDTCEFIGVVEKKSFLTIFRGVNKFCNIRGEMVLQLSISIPTWRKNYGLKGGCLRFVAVEAFFHMKFSFFFEHALFPRKYLHNAQY